MIPPILIAKTSFPMKGNLPVQEQTWLDWWSAIDMTGLQKAQRKDAPLFILHDGPPYANGPLHLGHALNKILKDFVTRLHFSQGYDVEFIPGWDCHGLPIEHQIETDLLKKGRLRKDVSGPEFRAQCRDFAQHWIGIQKESFKRFGVQAQWDSSYQTMDFGFESRILHHFYRLFKKGYIYQGLRPVLWSPSEQTALAEAEVEYKDKVSQALYVGFPIVAASADLQGALAVIWTTTPWSLPANRAISYGKDIAYGLYQVETESGQKARYVLAQDLWSSFSKQAGLEHGHLVRTVTEKELKESEAIHPLAHAGFSFKVPFLSSEFVTTQTGTGLVHTAPGHGLDDFVVGQRHGLEVASPIDGQGVFLAHVPLVGGLEMNKSQSVIVDALIQSGNLVFSHGYSHSYPHSWRSKKPLFYRATPQWFIALDAPHHVRDKALEALKTITWYPTSGEKRMEATLRARPDWCISRQRVWGVPIALFTHRVTGEPLCDDQVFERIETRIAMEGCDFWFSDQAYEVLDGLYDAKDWIKHDPIIDVWFESGVTHEVVLRDRQVSTWPADLYLEGSDQHRAWFQSSLILSMALEDKPPYRGVLTHGFTLDEKDMKMSKSLGNVVDPQDIVKTKGADILRLWVAYEDYHKDVRMGPSILDRVEEMYRRFRNTLRYCLMNLQGFSLDDLVPCQEWDFREAWIFDQILAQDRGFREDMKTYNFRSALHRLHCFCSQDLSSFYFDSHKDTLYCEPKTSLKRRSVQTALFHLLWALIHWLSPFLCFTTQEAWSCLAQDMGGFDPREKLDLNHPFLQKLVEKGFWTPKPYWALHLNTFSDWPDSWKNKEIVYEMGQLRTIRETITSALEKARQAKKIGNSLEAAPIVYLEPQWHDSSHLEELTALTLVAPIRIRKVSQLPDDVYHLDTGVGVTIERALGHKCERCWRVLMDVKGEPALCTRCADLREDAGQPCDAESGAGS